MFRVFTGLVASAFNAVKPVFVPVLSASLILSIAITIVVAIAFAAMRLDDCFSAAKREAQIASMPQQRSSMQRILDTMFMCDRDEAFIEFDKNNGLNGYPHLTADKHSSAEGA